ncbi:PadR family transcriptional regulator [Halosegnis marinus]|uniref:PadR family transcriptional regulator n=1 Tax=Halosegnis marinus TaxID=3034023 RepID=A0ABD5ZSQ4_9EURY|nr:helix-turn-helix transcriptional regulator [Halosegnis sp. DT85]
MHPPIPTRMSRPADTTLTRFQLHILAHLADGPAAGQTVKQALEADHGEFSHARVYHNLDHLAESGALTKTTDNSRTNEYRLTASGREALARESAFLARYCTPRPDEHDPTPEEAPQ